MKRHYLKLSLLMSISSAIFGADHQQQHGRGELFDKAQSNARNAVVLFNELYEPYKTTDYFNESSIASVVRFKHEIVTLLSEVLSHEAIIFRETPYTEDTATPMVQGALMAVYKLIPSDIEKLLNENRYKEITAVFENHRNQVKNCNDDASFDTYAAQQSDPFKKGYETSLHSSSMSANLILKLQLNEYKEVIKHIKSKALPSDNTDQ